MLTLWQADSISASGCNFHFWFIVTGLLSHGIPTNKQ